MLELAFTIALGQLIFVWMVFSITYVLWIFGIKIEGLRRIFAWLRNGEKF